MSFGVNAAPEKYQLIIIQLMARMKGVANIADDDDDYDDDDDELDVRWGFHQVELESGSRDIAGFVSEEVRDFKVQENEFWC